jgi:hypothetical protein
MTQTNSNLGSLLDESAPVAASGPAQSTKKGPGGFGSRDRWMTIAAVFGIVAALVILGYQIMGGPPSAAEMSTRLVLIDSESGEVFRNFRIAEGESAPWANPSTGRRTLFPAEKCFWTKDGKAKLEPTYVLLNEYAGKDGETKCPDCGRRVTGRNPMPPAALINEAIQREEQGK